MAARQTPARFATAAHVALHALLLAECAGLRESRQLLQGNKPEAKIANGQPAACGRFPYMVSMRNRGNTHKCGGVLVHPEWVLTAAHCVHPTFPGTLGTSPVLVIGACKLSDKNNENGVVEVSSPLMTVIHEGWTGDVADGNDIALLKLSEASKHAPALLPNESYQLGRGKLMALGWGEQEEGSENNGNELQETRSSTAISNNLCNAPSEDSWSGLIKDSMLCVFGFQGGGDVCGGDSGGPLLEAFSSTENLVDGDPESDVVVGITSFGESTKCGEATKPSVFTRVSSFRGWIDESIKIIPGQSPPPASPPENIARSAASAPAPPPLSSVDLPVPAESPMEAGQDDVGEKLWNASRDGNVDAAREALDEGASTEVTIGAGGDTPLIIASEKGHLDVVEVLLAAGADVSAQGSNGRTPLIAAARDESVKIVSALLEAEAEVDQAKDDGETPLIRASRQGHRAVAKVLIGAGADVDREMKSGLTPLYWASRNGHLDVVLILVQAGADVNKGVGNGSTPLYWATFSGHSLVVKTLIAADAGPNQANTDGIAPLHVVSRHLKFAGEAMARDLINAGSSLEAVDKRGWTPLHWAAYYGNTGNIELFLKEGADPDVTDNEGRTAAILVCSCEEPFSRNFRCLGDSCEEEGIDAEVADLLG